jgi:hypothetical protein
LVSWFFLAEITNANGNAKKKIDKRESDASE